MSPSLADKVVIRVPTLAERDTSNNTGLFAGKYGDSEFSSTSITCTLYIADPVPPMLSAKTSKEWIVVASKSSRFAR